MADQQLGRFLGRVRSRTHFGESLRPPGFDRWIAKHGLGDRRRSAKGEWNHLVRPRSKDRGREEAQGNSRTPPVTALFGSTHNSALGPRSSPGHPSSGRSLGPLVASPSIPLPPSQLSNRRLRRGGLRPSAFGGEGESWRFRLCTSIESRTSGATAERGALRSATRRIGGAHEHAADPAALRRASRW